MAGGVLAVATATRGLAALRRAWACCSARPATAATRRSPSSPAPRYALDREWCSRRKLRKTARDAADGASVAAGPALAAAGVAGERIASVCRRGWTRRAALLGWARRGFTIVLPVHDGASREELSRLLDGLHDDGWQAGDVLPERAGRADLASP